MINNDIPTKYISVGKDDEGVWISPLLDDGTVSTEKMFIPKDNRKVAKKDDIDKISKPAWGNASQMLDAARVLKENSLYIPSAALVSFSVELFMKSLILSNGSFSTEHKLDKLFNSLDEASKNDLMTIITKETTEAIFIDLLVNYSATFEKIRYVHEYINVPFHLDFLFKLAIILREYSAEKLGIEF